MIEALENLATLSQVILLAFIAVGLLFGLAGIIRR